MHGRRGFDIVKSVAKVHSRAGEHEGGTVRPSKKTEEGVSRYVFIQYRYSEELCLGQHSKAD
ncbi:hypothetical protein GMOD_00002573 [Pyrenophora seminiperda CCB06]|uniref:Uncharacterized protein n=1 Tax=Pyrenophora seminiperda CCB06 TaxID=1302712 RepID=A0A3M7M2Q0_9PLEO|nr:hypothetical protein GMOD_00002573 [Pyrenophora seminiperda CCB06]